jgi:hypothetical protein
MGGRARRRDSALCRAGRRRTQDYHQEKTIGIADWLSYSIQFALGNSLPSFRLNFNPQSAIRTMKVLLLETIHDEAVSLLAEC